MDKLTLQQQDFCRLYTTKGDTYSNGTLSYNLAYGHEIPTDENGKMIVDCKEYNVCKSLASRLLTNENIQGKIKAILLERFNDVSFADARIQDIIDHGKDTDAIQAVKVLNDLKQRITKKIDITSAGRPLAGLTDDELNDLIK